MIYICSPKSFIIKMATPDEKFCKRKAKGINH